MAHFAKIGMNGKVIQVLTMDNEEMKDDNGKDIITVQLKCPIKLHTTH